MIEDGAYLFVDFLCPNLPESDKWPRLTVSRELIFDLTPTRAPVLLELRRVIETWEESADIRPPEAAVAGTARILTVGRRTSPLTVRTDRNQTMASIRFREPGTTVAVRVATQVLFELADATRQESGSIRGHLAGIWVLGIPQVSAGMFLRAMRVIGPPIGLGPEGGERKREGRRRQSRDKEPGRLQ